MNRSGIAPDDPLAAETILTLFQDGEPSVGLTEFDGALISRLYNSPRNSWVSRIYDNVAARAVNLEEASTVSEE